MSEKLVTNYCRGCKVRQDKIDELEAKVRELEAWVKKARIEEHDLPHTPEFMEAVKQVEEILDGGPR